MLYKKFPNFQTINPGRETIDGNYFLENRHRLKRSHREGRTHRTLLTRSRQHQLRNTKVNIKNRPE